MNSEMYSDGVTISYTCYHVCMDLWLPRSCPDGIVTRLDNLYSLESCLYSFLAEEGGRRANLKGKYGGTQRGERNFRKVAETEEGAHSSCILSHVLF